MLKWQHILSSVNGKPIMTTANNSLTTSANIDAQGNPTDGKGAWRQFLCRACGWIYDEAKGDPDGGLPAGTRFEDIPDDWECPLCGVKKTDFEPFEARHILTPTQHPIAIELATNTEASAIVIIGAGLAGWSVVDAIRSKDSDKPIILITSDEGGRYHKPMLSVAISQNKTPDDLIRTTGIEAAKTANIHLVAETFVINIDAEDKMVRTTRGEFFYDKLILATGAIPALPPVLANAKVWHVNHIRQFAQLQQQLSHSLKQKQVKPSSQHRPIAVIGAGMIGIEIAEDIHTAGHEVVLFDLHPNPLAEMLPEIATQRIRHALEQKGVQFLGGHVVTDIENLDNGGHRLHYQATHHSADTSAPQSHTIEVEHIIASTGLVIDERLPTRAGIQFDKKTGIDVHPNTLKTSDEHIYAIGDCMSISGVACRYVAPLRQQANTIADEVLGIAHTGYQHTPPMIRLKTKSISVTATGQPSAQGNWRIVIDNENELKLEQMDDNGQITATATLKSS